MQRFNIRSCIFGLLVCVACLILTISGCYSPNSPGVHSFDLPSDETGGPWGPTTNGLRLSLVRIDNPGKPYDGYFRLTMQNVGTLPAHVPLGLDIQGMIAFNTLIAQVTDTQGHSVSADTIDGLSFVGGFDQTVIVLPPGAAYSVIIGYRADWIESLPDSNQKSDEPKHPFQIRLELRKGFSRNLDNHGETREYTEPVVSNPVVVWAKGTITSAGDGNIHNYQLIRTEK